MCPRENGNIYVWWLSYHHEAEPGLVTGTKRTEKIIKQNASSCPGGVRQGSTLGQLLLMLSKSREQTSKICTRLSLMSQRCRLSINNKNFPISDQDTAWSVTVTDSENHSRTPDKVIVCARILNSNERSQAEIRGQLWICISRGSRGFNKKLEVLGWVK